MIRRMLEESLFLEPDDCIYFYVDTSIDDHHNLVLMINRSSESIFEESAIKINFPTETHNRLLRSLMSAIDDLNNPKD